VSTGRRILRSILAITALLSVVSCQAAIRQQEEKKAQIRYFNTTVDRERILISTGDISNPHETLGEVSYTEPLNADSIDSAHMDNRLRQLAIDKWGNQVDAIIHVKSAPNEDASRINASGEAVRIKGDCDFCRHNYSQEKID
jgi:hypothetical protein